mgnify:CR=1 FL=1|tara:strand:+ start:114 stop:380 length:267 start_codon:yes stop_codon:yes gene_type:complete
MSTHEFTAADCTWADLHFSDLGEAREHLDDLIETKKSLESMKRLKEYAKTDIPGADIRRIELGIKELEKQESELAKLIAECSVDPLFD